MNKLVTGFIALLSAAVFSASVFAGGAKKDIVETAMSAGNFNTLVAAVEAADLVDTLKGEGPYTLFAPTDEAFAALPEGTIEDLLKPENKDKLITILKYHVVAWNLKSGDISGPGITATSIQGQTLKIDATDGMTINDATVTGADVRATNGVIHIIDKVLLPQPS